MACACTPAQRGGRDEPASLTPHDAADAAPALMSVDGGLPDTEGGPGDDGGTPRGEVVASATIADGGGELSVESMDGGFGVRLASSGDAGLAVEPTGHLDGPTPAALYFGPGCKRARPGRSVLLGRWTGELLDCVTAVQKLAIIEGLPTRHGCTSEPAAPGRYSLSVWPCGRTVEPLATVAFDVGDGGVSSGDAGVEDASQTPATEGAATAASRTKTPPSAAAAPRPAPHHERPATTPVVSAPTAARSADSGPDEAVEEGDAGGGGGSDDRDGAPEETTRDAGVRSPALDAAASDG